MNPKIFTENNYFFMLALDHRESFKKISKTENESKLIEYKYEIINSLIYQFSGVLIDEDTDLKLMPYLIKIY